MLIVMAIMTMMMRTKRMRLVPTTRTKLTWSVFGRRIYPSFGPHCGRVWLVDLVRIATTTESGWQACLASCKSLLPSDGSRAKHHSRFPTPAHCQAMLRASEEIERRMKV